MLQGRVTGPVELRRWTEVSEPNEDELARVEREVVRAFRRNAWERSPSSPASG